MPLSVYCYWVWISWASATGKTLKNTTRWNVQRKHNCKIPSSDIRNSPTPPDSSVCNKMISLAINPPLFTFTFSPGLVFSPGPWLSVWQSQPWALRVVATGRDSSRSPLSGRISAPSPGWLALPPCPNTCPLQLSVCNIKIWLGAHTLHWHAAVIGAF